MKLGGKKNPFLSDKMEKAANNGNKTKAKTEGKVHLHTHMYMHN